MDTGVGRSRVGSRAPANGLCSRRTAMSGPEAGTQTLWGGHQTTPVFLRPHVPADLETASPEPAAASSSAEQSSSRGLTFLNVLKPPRADTTVSKLRPRSGSAPEGPGPWLPGPVAGAGSAHGAPPPAASVSVPTPREGQPPAARERTFLRASRGRKHARGVLRPVVSFQPGRPSLLFLAFLLRSALFT